MKKLVQFSNHFMQRYLPDPYIIVIFLTVLVFALGIGLTGNTAYDMMVFWGDGFWNLLAFTMQMALVLITGHVLANSPFFKKLLQRMAMIAKSPGQAIILVTVVSLVASWINWGFGIVIGALFSKEVAKVVRKVDFRLLIASAYSGFLIWHGGFSGSIPLTIATEGHFSVDAIGIIPTSETIFSSYNLAIVVAIFIVLPLLNRLMLPPLDERVTIDPKVLDIPPSLEAATIEEPLTPAEKLQHLPIISYTIGLFGLSYVVYYFATNGFSINLNIVNFLFLFFRNFISSNPEAFFTGRSRCGQKYEQHYYSIPVLCRHYGHDGLFGSSRQT